MPLHAGRNSQSSARDGETSGRLTRGDESTRIPTLQPIATRPDLDAVKRMRLEMGTTTIEFAAEHLEDARPELIQAMKCLDTSEERDLHVRVGKVVNELDDLRSLLAERHAS